MAACPACPACPADRRRRRAQTPSTGSRPYGGTTNLVTLALAPALAVILVVLLAAAPPAAADQLFARRRVGGSLLRAQVGGLSSPDATTTPVGVQKLGVGLIKPGYVAMDRPGKGGPATPVQVGVKLLRVLDVIIVDDTLMSDLLIQLKWRDPRLANLVPAGSPPQRVDPLQVWTPGFELANARSPMQITHEGVKLSRDGTVHLIRKAVAPAVVSVDVSMFPFDKQELELLFESPDYGSNEVDFRVVANESTTDVDQEEVWEVKGWDVSRDTAPSIVDGAADVVVLARLTIKRMGGMAIVELVLPLFLVVNFNFLAFFVYAGDFGTRIGITSTGFLTVMAFLYVVSESLPKIAYCTWLHLYMAISFSAVFLVMLEVVIIHFLDPHNRAADAQKQGRNMLRLEARVDMAEAQKQAHEWDDSKMNPLMRDKAMQAFSIIDSNGDGEIEAEEMLRAMIIMGRPDSQLENAEAILRAYDFDGNTQTLTRPEFIRWVATDDTVTAEQLDSIISSDSRLCALGAHHAVAIDYWTCRLLPMSFWVATLSMLIIGWRA